MVEADTGYSGKRKSEQWDECSRCGFIYPLSQLRRQTGDGGSIIVCTAIPCYDEPSRGDLIPIELPSEPPLDIVQDG